MDKNDSMELVSGKSLIHQAHHGLDSQGMKTGDSANGRNKSFLLFFCLLGRYLD